MPFAIACLRAGAMASGSSAETTIALTFCCVSVWMNGICAAPVASEGPTCLNCPLSAVAASWPPDAATSKYGLLTAFGRKAMLRVVVVPLPPVLPPQATRARIAIPAVANCDPRLHLIASHLLMHCSPDLSADV